MDKPRTSPPRPLTPARLEAAALRYLERFSASREQLRRVLARRLYRATQSGQDLSEAGHWIPALLERLSRLGYLDDRRYGSMKLHSLRRQGNSTRTVRQKLAARGLPGGLLDELLAAEAEDETGPDAASADLTAARTLVRRRRLGFLRPETERAPRHQADLAILARAGFSRAIAEAALTESPPEVMESF